MKTLIAIVVLLMIATNAHAYKIIYDGQNRPVEIWDPQPSPERMGL